VAVQVGVGSQSVVGDRGASLRGLHGVEERGAILFDPLGLGTPGN